MVTNKFFQLIILLLIFCCLNLFISANVLLLQSPLLLLKSFTSTVVIIRLTRLRDKIFSIKLQTLITTHQFKPHTMQYFDSAQFNRKHLVSEICVCEETSSYIIIDANLINCLQALFNINNWIKTTKIYNKIYHTVMCQHYFINFVISFTNKRSAHVL